MAQSNGTGPKDVTTLLLEWRGGNHEALNELTPLIYSQLRRIAGRLIRRERREHTLQSTALVHEVYLKLVDQHRVQWHDRDHFFAVASHLIRRILIVYARSRKAAKRGGEAAVLPFEESIAVAPGREASLVALNDALTGLAHLDPRQAQIVELRFFAGLSIESTAHVLGISPATVKRDWIVARMWLYRELSHGAN